MRVSARIGRDEEVVTHAVTLHRSSQLMVSSDKPVYQPGDQIRIRSLALRRPDLKPVAGGDVTFSVADPKGNIIFRRRDVTSRYGIAAADCPLADEILLGVYRIECRVGDTTSKTDVEVKRHVLPKFKVAIDADRTYYQPGELISGTVQADYFFGKPVADATVRIDVASGATGDGAAEPITVKTNKGGRAEFSIRASKSLARQQHDSDDALIALKATVVDAAGQTESRSLLARRNESRCPDRGHPRIGTTRSGGLERGLSHDDLCRSGRPAVKNASAGNQRIRSRVCDVRSRNCDGRVQA